MTIQTIQIGQAGVSNQTPSWVYIETNDTYATVTTAGYLNGAAHEYLNSLQPNMMALVSTRTSQGIGVPPVVYVLQITNVAGVWSLSAPALDVPIPFIVPGVIEALVSTSSATPGTIRAMIGSMTETATTMTSGNIVGVRGVVNMVGASGGFIYGTQGKVIVTGTLSGSEWTAGLFGQLDISAATINAGQAAPIWGDYGSASHTLTNQTGLYGIAMTNTTAAVLAGQLYLYGGATTLMLLNTNAGLSGVTYFKNSGTGAGSWGNATPPTPSKVLTISVDGTLYYLPLVAQNT